MGAYQRAGTERSARTSVRIDLALVQIDDLLEREIDEACFAEPTNEIRVDIVIVQSHESA